MTTETTNPMTNCFAVVAVFVLAFAVAGSTVINAAIWVKAERELHTPIIVEFKAGEGSKMTATITRGEPDARN